MSELTIIKEVPVGSVAKSEKSKFVVSYVESSAGKYIAVQNMYKRKDEWNNGKAMWIPTSVAHDIAGLISLAMSGVEEIV